jgi:excisionase family DNA binding protein
VTGRLLASEGRICQTAEASGFPAFSQEVAVADGQDEYLSTSEAAAILGIKEDAVRAAFDRGDLTGMRTRPGSGGHRRPSRASVEAYRRQLHGDGQDVAGA